MPDDDDDGIVEGDIGKNMLPSGEYCRKVLGFMRSRQGK